MFILSIEQSSAVGSVALLRDSTVLAEEQWKNERARNQHLFQAIPRVCAQAGVELADIHVFATGLGPGSFSGLRISLSAAQALAMPSGAQVLGITSGQALANRVALDLEVGRVAVVGDARRDRFWFVEFDTSDSFPRQLTAYELIQPNQLHGLVRHANAVVSPDWDRLASTLSTCMHEDPRLLARSVVPTAERVGELALLSIRHQHPLPDLEPVYLHPPVFVQPRYPGPDAT